MFVALFILWLLNYCIKLNRKNEPLAAGQRNECNTHIGLVCFSQMINLCIVMWCVCTANVCRTLGRLQRIKMLHISVFRCEPKMAFCQMKWSACPAEQIVATRRNKNGVKLSNDLIIRDDERWMTSAMPEKWSGTIWTGNGPAFRTHLTRWWRHKQPNASTNSGRSGFMANWMRYSVLNIHYRAAV